MAFLEKLAQGVPDDMTISTEVAAWLLRVANALDDHRSLLKHGPIDDADRKRLMDALGEAFGEYRHKVYAAGLSGQTACRRTDVQRLLTAAREHLDHAIACNRRADGLYHSYNLLTLSPDGLHASVANMREMLEGQVAILASGVLSGRKSLDLIEALFSSQMYRPDQHSFMLYPANPLPNFLNKNFAPSDRVAATPLLKKLLAAGDGRIITLDPEGNYRFATTS